jgi:L-alanine-DL-glutamate epimerase-like enolase superfamily enzyme
VRIRTVTPYWISLPLLKPIKMSSVTIKTTENLLVRVEDTDGHVGWGEAASAPTMTGDFPEGMVAAVQWMKLSVEGMEVEGLSGFAKRIDGLIYGNEWPKSAIDMAVHDLAGKRAGVPTAELLGGVVRRDIPVLFMLAEADRVKDLDMARRKIDEGFVSFKVKIGTTSVEADLDRCAAVRELLGKSVRISADANQGYSREQALQFAKGAAAAGLDFIEQPIDGHDVEGMALVAAATPVPLGADEGIHSHADIERHHQMKAAKGASLKTIKLGGMSPVMVAGKRMQALGMSVNLAGKIADSSVASAGIVQLAAALPQIDWDTSVTCQYLAEDIAKAPVAVERGHVRLSDKPGLGLEIDEAKLSRTAVKLAA